MHAIYIVVFWCVTSAPFDSFNPHQLSAAAKFVAENPATCRSDPPEWIDGPTDVNQCGRDALLRYMPSWLEKNPGKVYLYATCFERRSEPLDLEAVKRHMNED